MKIKDIPSFTRNAYYQIDVTFDELFDWIERQTPQGLNLDPDYQRDHVWSTEQQSAYIEFIVSGGSTGKDFHFNMPGWQDDYSGDFELVDGKQRTQAILKFINNELPIFGCLLNEFDKPVVLLRKTNIKIHVNNLKTRKEVLQWYIQFNSCGTAHTAEEIDKVKNLIKDKV